MKRVLVMWPPKIEYIFSIQKHYTNFGETIAYLMQDKELEIDVMDGSALLFFQWDFIKAYSTEYDFLVIYTDLHNGISAIKAARQCKAISANTVIMSFGQGAPYAPDVFLQEGFDAVIFDPMYQKSIWDFIRYKSGRLTKEQLRGIAYKENDKVVYAERKYDLNVAEVSYPALDKLPVEQYKKISGRDQICFTVARGCCYDCQFCRVPVDQGKVISYRPIPDILNYVESVKNDFASIKFIAPTFTANRNWVLDLCASILDANLRFKWIVTTRLELLDDEMLQLMSKAGCIAIAFGMETLYEETQKAVNKFMPQELILKQVRLIQRHGIIPKAFIMLGIPGQSKQEINDTYLFLRENKVEIRPKEYYPYDQLLTTSNKLELLHLFERDTVYKTTIPGVETAEFVNWLLDRTNVR